MRASCARLDGGGAVPARQHGPQGRGGDLVPRARRRRSRHLPSRGAGRGVRRQRRHPSFARRNHETAAALRAARPASARGLFGRSLLLTRDWTRCRDRRAAAAGPPLRGRRPRRAARRRCCPTSSPTRCSSTTRRAPSRPGPARRRAWACSPVIVDGSYDPGRARRDRRGDRRDAGHELARAGRAPRPDPRRGQPLHARGEAAASTSTWRRTRDPRKVPVVNLQCDIDHPTQALADLMWLREYFPGGLAGQEDRR